LIIATICEITQDDKLLLQLKAEGKFGEGKWNGPGGKVKEGETPEQCVIREVQEETGLTIKEPKLRGILDFYFGEKEAPDWIAYIYHVTDFEGKLTPNEEGKLRWFNYEDIPYDEMWQDDLYWLPPMLMGHSFKGTFWFNEEGSKLIRHHLELE
jgi:8-oxo-dGTP diphosphatase